MDICVRGTIFKLTTQLKETQTTTSIALVSTNGSIRIQLAFDVFLSLSISTSFPKIVSLRRLVDSNHADVRVLTSIFTISIFNLTCCTLCRVNSQNILLIYKHVTTLSLDIVTISQMKCSQARRVPIGSTSTQTHNTNISLVQVSSSR